MSVTVIIGIVVAAVLVCTCVMVLRRRSRG
ncbi:hypothetical protein HD597_010427 [Nonomuraea thailandensis]|uniref:Uncharacterized protein n=1 Tax=Nonomuraea thailandensis TaxID=1188745 RepID=A0A9X2GTC2_9ACTN|nr:hypothetical protein [Nonomuraea thailandensis]